MKRYLFLIFFVGFSSCAWFEEDLEAQLPPMTQHGANTFACIFDGEIFQPNNYRPRDFTGKGGIKYGLSVSNNISDNQHNWIKIGAISNKTFSCT